VDDVSGSAELVGECSEARSLSLCVMKQQYLCHGALLIAL
jgi:hypothetical protein